MHMADQARAITLPAFYSDIQADNKNATVLNSAQTFNEFDPVTQADIEAEKCLRRAIEDAFAQDGILGEELSDKAAQNKWSWCLDPIDGTRGFVAGVPLWSTLIALCYDDKPVLGIIDMPALNERYVGIIEHNMAGHDKTPPAFAWKITSTGASQLQVRPCARLNDVILGCTEPMAMFAPGQMAAFEMIRRTAKFARLGLDAYAYALVASGRMDMVLEASMKPYDILALIPVVQGAGGVLTNWHGGDDFSKGEVTCAGDSELLKETYVYLQRALD